MFEEEEQEEIWFTENHNKDFGNMQKGVLFPNQLFIKSTCSMNKKMIKKKMGKFGLLMVITMISEQFNIIGIIYYRLLQI